MQQTTGSRNGWAGSSIAQGEFEYSLISFSIDFTNVIQQDDAAAMVANLGNCTGEKSSELKCALMCFVSDSGKRAEVGHR